MITEPTSKELAMREAVAAWARARRPGVRVIHELVCDDCRIDQAFLREADLIGCEIKSSADTLARLDRQAHAYDRRFPEWWIAVAPKWKKRITERRSREFKRPGILVVEGDHVEQIRMAKRDELVIMHMLQWLWTHEAQRIAERTNVYPSATKYRCDRSKLLPLLARLLTGNELIKEICTELRARPAFGHRSDAPVLEGARATAAAYAAAPTLSQVSRSPS